MKTSSPGPGVAVVSGGTGAVGSEVCRILAETGHDVLFTYRSNGAAATQIVESLEKLGRRVEATALDLTDEAATDTFIEQAADRFGGIHTVVHAGGPFVPQVYLSRITPEVFRRQVEQEVVGFYNLMHPALAHLRAARGAIVAITTVALRRFPVRDGLSSGAKAGIEALVRSIAAEEGPYGIRANCVGPGLLADGMAATLHESGEFDEESRKAAIRSIPLRRFGSATDVAEAACFLASAKARYITGQSLDVDGGYQL